MPISYTNRKERTFFLCQGITNTGKPRYFFSLTARPDALEQIPTGYHIEESANGVVSLVKDRQQLILPEEIQLVEECPAPQPEREQLPRLGKRQADHRL